MKTIYNVAVLMDSQAQCNRMKQLCINNGLPIWGHKCSFKLGIYCNVFRFVEDKFFVATPSTNQSLVTESEFIELLKNHKG
jgi:hypothetical protein